MSYKLHNPKSHSPAVYIPCWLIQVPNNLLSFAAKCLYGRLSQWSNERGHVFRSYNQLAQEIGSTKRSVNDYLRELRACGLIGTLQPQAGGLNHFVFYEHPWMSAELNKFLAYKSDPDPEQDFVPPEQDSALPPRAGFCSTPEQDSASINIKEIKTTKDLNIPGFEKPGTSKLKDYQEDLRFMRFYTAYPKHEDPRDAWKAFKSIVGNDDEILEKIMLDIEERKLRHTQWKDKQFIKHPAVYLRKGEYLGEIYNATEQNQEQAKVNQEQAAERIKHQDELSRKNADEMRIKYENMQNDGIMFRNIVKQVKVYGQRPEGLTNLRASMGLPT